MKTSAFALYCLLAGCLLGASSFVQAEESTGKSTEKKQPAVENKLPDALSKPVFTPSLRDDLSANQFEDEKKAARLIEQREMTILKMHQTRKYILNNDVQAKELYTQMMELAARLTVVIENKKSMRDLNKSLKKLDDAIAALPKKEALQKSAKDSSKELSAEQ